MKKKILLSAFLLTLGISATSYLYLQDPHKSYQERVENQNAGEAYKASHLRENQNGEIDPMDRTNVLNKLRHRVNRAEPLGLDWAFRGPDNVGGRTRGMIELFGKPETLLIGSVSGGLFYSYNGGAFWQPHDQFNNQDSSSSVIGCIAQDTTSGAIYVGTGSSYDIDLPGYGIYKSTDDGETFQHLTATKPDDRLDFGDLWTAINRIAVAPNGDVYAATESGLWASYDEGETWINPVYSDPNFAVPNTGRCSDVSTTKDGHIVVAYATGALFISEDGSDKSFIRQLEVGLPAGGITRTNLAIYPEDPDIMYLAFTASDASLASIYKTTNGGESWFLLLEPFDDFTPFCGFSGNCQGDWDACIGVSPIDPNTIFIGGVEIWRYDGSLTRVASEGGGPPSSDVLPFYVHADKHLIYFSPNDPNRMYVTSDGGVTRTENRGTSWQGMNKGYSTTQFYGMAFSPDGAVLAGAQDNGSLAVLGDNAFDPYVGLQVYGNDGFDCEISQAAGLYFVTSQFSEVQRGEPDLPSASLTPGVNTLNPDGPFWSIIRLWETTSDLSSKDSLIFGNDSVERSIGVSNGAVKSYQETIVPVQSAAQVIPNSIRVFSGDQKFNNSNDITVLEGDGNGAIAFNDDGSFNVEVNFNRAPAENSNIFVRFAVKYKANDILIIESQNLQSSTQVFTFEHRLENDLNPGDAIVIQDPVQSILARSSGAGISFYRGVLDTREIPDEIRVSGVGNSINCVEFTPDGDIAYVGSGGAVYRIRGLNEVYTQEDADALYSDSDENIDVIHTVNGGQVQGLTLDPNDDSRLIVSVSGYGGSSNVVELTNARNTTGSATSRNVQGDLAGMPVYDAEIDVNDPNIVVIATEFGIWATSDVSANPVSWSDENDKWTYIPVYDVRQQQLPFSESPHSGVYYVGTHGRGMWESRSIVGISDFNAGDAQDKAISSFKIFPNPVTVAGTIEYETNFTGSATISIYDLNGRVVKSWQNNTAPGKNFSKFDVNTLRSGSYFATIEMDGVTEASKFMVLK